MASTATPPEFIDDEYDLIFLSDFEDDHDAVRGSGQSLGAKGKGRATLSQAATSFHAPPLCTSETYSTGSPSTTLANKGREPASQRGQSGRSSSSGDEECDEGDRAGVDNVSDDDDDVDEPEEIQYEFDNDMLLIMPGMLRDYSHHATNYHPELWHTSIPGDYETQKTAARMRAQDRRLDREELLKNSVSPTTCGICFERFSTFDLGPLPPSHPSASTSSAPSLEQTASARIEMARNFTFQVARSFGMIKGTAIAATSEHRSQEQEEQQQPSSNFPRQAFTTTGSLQSPLAEESPDDPTTAQQQQQQQQQPPDSIASKEIGIIMPCQHGLCLSCLQTYLIHSLQDPKARFPIQCPQPGCRSPIPVDSGELVLEREQLDTWYRKLAEIHVANKACCPRPECGAIIDLDDRDGTVVRCPECMTSYCASCAVPYHRGLTCEQYRGQVEGGGNTAEEDLAMVQMIKDRRWRHCPSCRFVIEKTQGCPHVVCHCGQSMCFSCGSPWDEMEARCSENCGNPDYYSEAPCLIM
ncbi:hypothetical protein DFQ26_005960 [Actinomortierella ambigua]|nr:hypothetical protein DFQ26_005960 [Actinomortierella ambigua]